MQARLVSWLGPAKEVRSVEEVLDTLKRGTPNAFITATREKCREGICYSVSVVLEPKWAYKINAPYAEWGQNYLSLLIIYKNRINIEVHKLQGAPNIPKKTVTSLKELPFVLREILALQKRAVQKLPRKIVLDNKDIYLTAAPSIATIHPWDSKKEKALGAVIYDELLWNEADLRIFIPAKESVYINRKHVLGVVLSEQTFKGQGKQITLDYAGYHVHFTMGTELYSNIQEALHFHKFLQGLGMDVSSYAGAKGWVVYGIYRKNTTEIEVVIDNKNPQIAEVEVWTKDENGFWNPIDEKKISIEELKEEISRI